MNTNQRFKDKIVIVTGAAQGIGEGVAVAAAQEGAQLIIADRSPLLHEVAALINGAGGAAVPVMADLETYAGARAVVQGALDHYGRVDVLINNVGGTIWAMPYQEYEEQIKAEIKRSLFPSLWCCHAVLPAMIARQHGVIVNVSSIATRSIHRIPYAAAKGGVNAMTASLAIEHAGDGIHVNAVATTGGANAPPRKVARNPKPLSPQEEVWYQAIVNQTIASSLMRRYGEIEDQVRAILFLASDEARYITGSVLPVAGGDQGSTSPTAIAAI